MPQNERGRAPGGGPNRMMLRRTLFLMSVCGIAAFLALGARLCQIQIFQHDEYEAAAIAQQVRETTVSAARGTIYDRNGAILAISAGVDTVYISPAEIERNNEDKEAIARGLAEILDADYETILKKAGNTKSWYEVVARKVEAETAELVRKFKAEGGYVGIKIESDTKRYYPNGSLASHVIGFVGLDNTGLGGIESRYDSLLSGENGAVALTGAAGPGFEALAGAFTGAVGAFLRSGGPSAAGLSAWRPWTAAGPAALALDAGREAASLTARMRPAPADYDAILDALDADGSTTLINPPVYTLLHLPDQTADIRAAAPDILSIFDRVLESEQAVRETIWQGDIALRLSVSPLVMPDGTLAGCVGILSDVTSAERLEQTRRDYVANVSHELRTPLTAMRALLEPLRDGLIKTEEQRQQTYDVVLRETMRLSRLVSDMLELSRLQSGKASLSRSVFEPLPLMDLIHETYSAYAEDYQQTFVYDVPRALPHVVGNPDRTQQVLIALLDNAFKYTPEGGCVTLSASVEGDIVRVTVRDTGIGIGKEDLPHVFDRFYKADKAHHSKGTGLGLAIAYEIMKHLGEEMTVSSELGKGSAFSFTLHIATDKDKPLLLPA